MGDPSPVENAAPISDDPAGTVGIIVEKHIDDHHLQLGSDIFVAYHHPDQGKLYLAHDLTFNRVPSSYNVFTAGISDVLDIDTRTGIQRGDRITLTTPTMLTFSRWHLWSQPKLYDKEVAATAQQYFYVFDINDKLPVMTGAGTETLGTPLSSLRWGQAINLVGPGLLEHPYSKNEISLYGLTCADRADPYQTTHSLAWEMIGDDRSKFTFSLERSTIANADIMNMIRLDLVAKEREKARDNQYKPTSYLAMGLQATNEMADQSRGALAILLVIFLGICAAIIALVHFRRQRQLRTRRV